jgi:hypothetical protein
MTEALRGSTQQGRFCLNLSHVQGPAVAVGFVQAFVGIFVVGDACGGAVPLEVSAAADGDVAQQDEVGEQAGPGEVTAGGLAARAGFVPFAPGARAAGQRLRDVGKLPGWGSRGSAVDVEDRIHVARTMQHSHHLDTIDDRAEEDDVCSPPKNSEGLRQVPDAFARRMDAAPRT